MCKSWMLALRVSVCLPSLPPLCLLLLLLLHFYLFCPPSPSVAPCVFLSLYLFSLSLHPLKVMVLRRSLRHNLRGEAITHTHTHIEASSRTKTLSETLQLEEKQTDRDRGRFHISNTTCMPSFNPLTIPITQANLRD